MKKQIKTDKIINFAASMGAITPSDLAAEFSMSLDTARQRLKRMSEKGIFEREINPTETVYTIKTATAHKVDNATAEMGKILKFMRDTNDPALRFVPERLGGSNTGGGYVYHWKKLLEIMQRRSEREPKMGYCDCYGMEQRGRHDSACLYEQKMKGHKTPVMCPYTPKCNLVSEPKYDRCSFHNCVYSKDGKYMELVK